MKGSPTATTLGDQERFWANHQPFLESCGYMLRRRYRPGWIPDILTGKSVLHCEDSLGTSVRWFLLVCERKKYEELIMIYHSGSSSRRHSHLGRRTGGAKNRRHIFTGYPDVMVPDE